MTAENTAKLFEVIGDEGIGEVLKTLADYTYILLSSIKTENSELKATIKAAEKLEKAGRHKCVETILGILEYTEDKEEE